MNAAPVLINPHLEGESFLWEAGETGILLVHGLTATTAEVRPLAKNLFQAGYTVAGPLLPGHGTTPHDCNAVRWEAWLESVEAAYEELARRCRRVFVGGESTGALLAIHLAVSHPEAAGVLAYAPAFRLAARSRELVLLRVNAPFVESVPKRTIRPRENWQGYPVWPLKATVELLELQRVVGRLLPRLTQPLLIVQGRLDKTLAPASAPMLFERAGSQAKDLYWMEESGHVVVLERELDQIVEITLGFLGRVGKPVG